MYCRKCGTPNDDNAYTCVRCGEVMQQPDAGGSALPAVPNYLAQSIIVTLLCCMPLGIPAIVFAAQVNTKLQAGDVEGALDASRKAKLWCWWSFGVGFFGTLLYILFMLATILFSS